MRQAKAKTPSAEDPVFHRVEVDALLQSELSRFFAEKLRAGVA